MHLKPHLCSLLVFPLYLKFEPHHHTCSCAVSALHASTHDCHTYHTGLSHRVVFSTFPAIVPCFCCLQFKITVISIVIVIGLSVDMCGGGTAVSQALSAAVMKL